MGATKQMESNENAIMDGPLNVIKMTEEWRVVGRGFSIRCRDEQAALKTLAKVQSVWGS